MSPARLTLLTTIAMLAFAANSLLNRIALTETDIDAASFTLIRLFSAALFLLLFLLWRRKAASTKGASTKSALTVWFKTLWQNGSWWSAAALLLYAGGFSFAYRELTAATGALLLFGAVQATMIAWGLWQGERPNRIQLLGLISGLAGVVWLLLPGVSAPDPSAAVLMLAAGISWGMYSLRGKGSKAPVSSTCANFIRGSLLALPLGALLMLIPGAMEFHPGSAAGVGYALVSGVLASGAGYALWYSVLPFMQATTAATVQLTVPAITAAAGVLIAGESLDARLLVAFLLIIGGVAVFIRCRN